jgi:hypothetical protein
MKVLGVEVPPAAVEQEPVLDVPAIDMTGQPDTVPADVGTSDVATPARRRRAAKPKAGPATAATKAGTAKRSRDGSVGRETFAAVEALVRDGSSKTDAFKAVAEKSNRSAGTVAAAYYRAARSLGAAKPRRGRDEATTALSTSTRSAGRRGAQSSSGRARRRSAGQPSDSDRLMNDLVQSVNQLAAAMKAQSVEVADLRQRLDGVRSILD